MIGATNAIRRNAPRMTRQAAAVSGRGGRLGLALCAILLLVTGAGGLVGDAAAEQASAPAAPAAGGLDAGGLHSCAVLSAGGLRCWGYGASGQLGYGNTNTIGDDETPASAAPVNLGGHSVKAIAAGEYHTCALLDDQTVRCWGFGGDGRLGYANTNDVLDPGAVGAVQLGGPAVAITAGTAHTCAILVDGSVRCWGFARGGDAFQGDGRLGYDNNDNVGDDETPAAAGPVKLGGTAVAISAGDAHTCAILDDNTVRCWGEGASGQLGYGNTDNTGYSYNPSTGDYGPTTPDMLGPVNLGSRRTALSISAGGLHTCAILDHGDVRCWGEGGAGQLGYGNRDNIGDNETPDTVGPVRVGGEAVAISAGTAHTCAVLAGGSARCWGLGATGRLGYGNQDNIGDNELPSSVAPVDLGAGRTATAISAGKQHTCARLDGGYVRCWGNGAEGRLGYCNQVSIGDDETPGTAGPVNLVPGDGGAGCPVVSASSSAPASSGPGAVPTAPATPPGAARDTTRPVVRGLGVFPARFTLGSLLPRLAHVARVGTTIRFSLSERTAVSLSFARRHFGRLVGRTCRAATRALRSRPLCRRFATVLPSVRFARVRTGANRVRFQGRLSGTRTLRPGHYRLTVRATDPAGNRSRPKRVLLTASRRAPRLDSRLGLNGTAGFMG